MKRIISIIITLLVLFCLLGCEKQNAPDPQITDEPTLEKNEPILETDAEADVEFNVEADVEADIEADVETDVETDLQADEDLNFKKPEKPKNDLSEAELVKIVAKNLGVPDKAGITYEVSEKFYWEAGQVYFKTVTFYENDDSIAFASVDPRDGELIRNIYKYDNND